MIGHTKIDDISNPNNLYNGIEIHDNKGPMTSSETMYYRTYQSRDGAPLPGHAYCTTMRADVSLSTSSAVKGLPLQIISGVIYKGLPPPPPPPTACDVIMTT